MRPIATSACGSAMRLMSSAGAGRGPGRGRRQRRSAAARRAVDAEAGLGLGLEPGRGDRLAAGLAGAVGVACRTWPGRARRPEALDQLVDQRLVLAPLRGHLARVGEVRVVVEALGAVAQLGQLRRSESRSSSSVARSPWIVASAAINLSVTGRSSVMHAHPRPSGCSAPGRIAVRPGPGQAEADDRLGVDDLARPGSAPGRRPAPPPRPSCAAPRRPGGRRAPSVRSRARYSQESSSVKPGRVVEAGQQIEPAGPPADLLGQLPGRR